MHDTTGKHALDSVLRYPHGGLQVERLLWYELVEQDIQDRRLPCPIAIAFQLVHILRGSEYELTCGDPGGGSWSVARQQARSCLLE